jgi:hypothetical protein
MRLIDADALLEAIKADRYTNAQDAIFFITNAPTVEREGWVSVEPIWIVNNLGELGVKVGNRCFFLYKGENIEYEDALNDDDTPMMYRIVGKREFGETCKPIIHMKVEDGVIYDRTPLPYKQELTYIQGLSFGTADDGKWQPLPAAPKE